MNPAGLRKNYSGAPLRRKSLRFLPRGAVPFLVRGGLPGGNPGTQRHGPGHGRSPGAPLGQDRPAQGLRSGRIPLLHQPPEPQGPPHLRAAAGLAPVPLGGPGAAGHDQRRGAGPRRRGVPALLLLEAPGEPDQRLGLAPEPAGGLPLPARPGLGGGPATGSARRRSRSLRTGEATGSVPAPSSSGRAAPTASTTGSSTRSGREGAGASSAWLPDRASSGSGRACRGPRPAPRCSRPARWSGA